ncbi:MAG: hypothetical protein ACXW4U_09310, partial [Anaerolineales bacterium]
LNMTLSRVLRTKLIPPPRNARTLARPRVSQILKQALDYRLTILQAEARYGKSTALAELAAELPVVIWYQANDEDNDPSRVAGRALNDFSADIDSLACTRRSTHSRSIDFDIYEI